MAGCGACNCCTARLATCSTGCLARAARQAGWRDQHQGCPPLPPCWRQRRGEESAPAGGPAQSWLPRAGAEGAQRRQVASNPWAAAGSAAAAEPGCCWKYLNPKPSAGPAAAQLLGVLAATGGCWATAASEPGRSRGWLGQQLLQLSSAPASAPAPAQTDLLLDAPPPQQPSSGELSQGRRERCAWRRQVSSRLEQCMTARDAGAAVQGRWESASCAAWICWSRDPHFLLHVCCEH